MFLKSRKNLHFSDGNPSIQDLQVAQATGTLNQIDDLLNGLFPQSDTLPQAESGQRGAGRVSLHLLQQRHQGLVRQQGVLAQIHLLHLRDTAKHRGHGDDVA